VPYVNVRITRDGVTPAHKRALISGITDLLADVLGKDPETTFVVIDEVAVQDWGVAGVTADEYRLR
jgi:4-oxalocrotonate tautomerase